MYCHVALKHFNHDTLTYRCLDRAEHLVGHRVLVPYGKSKKIGIIVAYSDHHELDDTIIKPYIKRLDSNPILTKIDIAFIEKMANYYQTSFNDFVLQIIPKGILDNPEPIYHSSFVHQTSYKKDFKRLQRIASQPLYWSQLLEHAPIGKLNEWIDQGVLTPSPHSTLHHQNQLSPLNTHQQDVYQRIQNHKPTTHLIWGVTGSGKTEIYTHLAHHCLQSHQSVLLLVPEIALTHQTAKTIENRLGVTVIVLHSQLSPKQKMIRWINAQSIQPVVIIGTRSALFCSTQNLGLIIVDEEHDDSFRQDTTPSFSARDGAVLLGKMLNVPVILGSATPSLESFYNAQSNKYQLHHLNMRYHQTTPTLKITTLQANEFISPHLIEYIQQRLHENEHVMLYIGKRGYSRLLMCHHCSYQHRCKGCDRPLTQHQSKELKCHHCEQIHPHITDCPECQQSELSPFGAGSQRIEELAKEFWPSHPVIRVDRDQHTSIEVAEIIHQLSTQPATVIVGTQMLTKGHNIHRLNTVVVINVDQGLFSSDFRAEEKLFAELIQVSGRCARYQSPGTVFIQTRFPNHPVFTNLNNIPAHYQHMLTLRKEHQLPPAQFLSCVFLYGKANITTQLPRLILPQYRNVMISGPMLYPAGKRNHIECFQIIVSSSTRSDRDRAFAHITQYIKQSVHRNIKIKCQVDSHLTAF